MTSSQLRVAVVGGSLGGLNCGLRLRDAGCAVQIFERSALPLQARGAGIVLNPATVRYLADRDTVDLERISSAARWFRYLDAGLGVAHEEPCDYRFASYNSLYEAFLGCFDGDYRLGERCTGLELGPDRVSLRFEDGESRSYDLAVFADGVRSTGRAALLPDVEPRYAGYVAWRGAVSEAELSEDSFAQLDEAITYTVLADGHVLAYPIPGHAEEPGQRLINWLWYRNVGEGAELDDLLTGRDGARFGSSLPPGFVREEHVRRLREDAAAVLPAALAETVARTAEPFIQVILDVDVPRIAFGRACLIGDAAFTLRPHVAAGTAKAAEDAWKLGEAVAAARGDVPAALGAWEPPQLALGRDLARRTRDAGRRLQGGTWRVGEPLPFGLYAAGDSAMRGGAGDRR
jgi:2,6-dihydroxypyridine 3-monooxygenase